MSDDIRKQIRYAYRFSQETGLEIAKRFGYVSNATAIYHTERYEQDHGLKWNQPDPAYSGGLSPTDQDLNYTGEKES